MASDKNSAKDSKKCVTHEFRVSYPNVFEAKEFEGDGNPKFNITMLFPKTVKLGKAAPGEANSLRGIVKAAAREKWGEDESKWPKDPKQGKNAEPGSGLRMPWRDGDDERADVDGYEGCMFVMASSRFRPGLIDLKGRVITDPEDFYAGCYARAQVRAFAYDTKGNKGVSLELLNLQKTKNGDPFSGRQVATEVFSIEESDDDETEETEEDEDEDTTPAKKTKAGASKKKAKVVIDDEGDYEEDDETEDEDDEDDEPPAKAKKKKAAPKLEKKKKKKLGLNTDEDEDESDF